MAAFVLRDLFLSVSTCRRQTNKTDALGTRSLWVHCGIWLSLSLSRISDKSQGSWLHHTVCQPSQRRQTDKNNHFSSLLQILRLYLNFSLIQHRSENVAKETGDSGRFLSMEPGVFTGVFTSVPSAPGVGYIIPHITAQVAQLTKGVTRFTTSLNLHFYLPLPYYLVDKSRKEDSYKDNTFIQFSKYLLSWKHVPGMIFVLW